LKLRIVKDEGGRLEMEVGGEGHTLLNLLQSSLLRNKDVKMAGYSKPHPLINRSILYVDAEGKSAKEALLTAAQDAKNLIDEFKPQFEEGVAEFRKGE